MTELAIPFGLRWPDGNVLCEGVPIDRLASRAVGEARRIAEEPAAAVSTPTFDVFPPGVARDPGDPKDVGWTVVVAEDDPLTDETLTVLQPLMEHRGIDARAVLRYPGGDENARADWIDSAYLGLGANRPRYLLLAGAPTLLPFELQATLASAGASVGRVDFDESAHLEAYVEKVRAHEAPSAPYAEPKAIVWATDGGPRDATHYSRAFMAEPIVGMVRSTAGFGADAMLGTAATKDALMGSMSQRPGLVFTASHGMAASVDDGLDIQKRVNGGWCCQRAYGSEVEEWLLVADDLPTDGDVWPGALVVQFSCWGYGTPSVSTFAHWSGAAGEITATEPFTAAIPKKLLANPNGPIGYIGHVDTAWLHGFDNPDHPIPDGLYDPRLEVMLTLVARSFLLRTASGFGLRDLTDRASLIASELANLTNRLRSDGETMADLDAAELRDLADLMIRRNDAKWFLFYGDPGVRVRVGD